MRHTMLTGLVAAGLMVSSAIAAADPPPDPVPAPPPPPLNLNAMTPVKPSEFAMADGEYYGFAVPGDIACAISRKTGKYGCTGALPAAPDGANAVTGAQQGPATFMSDSRPLFNFSAVPNRLLPGSRISFRNVTCGTDGTMTMCNNSFDGNGFVLSPAGSYALGTNNPLLLNTGEGHNPYFN